MYMHGVYTASVVCLYYKHMPRTFLLSFCLSACLLVSVSVKNAPACACARICEWLRSCGCELKSRCARRCTADRTQSGWSALHGGCMCLRARVRAWAIGRVTRRACACARHHLGPHHAGAHGARGLRRHVGASDPGAPRHAPCPARCVFG